MGWRMYFVGVRIVHETLRVGIESEDLTGLHCGLKRLTSVQDRWPLEFVGVQISSGCGRIPENP